MPRKPPTRTCIACSGTADKRALVRFVRLADGSVAFDGTGRRAGRGAYLHDSMDCFERARSRHLLDKALRVKVDGREYERLEEEFRAACVDRAHRGDADRDGE